MSTIYQYQSLKLYNVEITLKLPNYALKLSTFSSISNANNLSIGYLNLLVAETTNI